ncbi:hypothetical protein INR49_032186 [Caranx melampygus]|nr:hypothetical protein INR49_032186 [Caranx melampygus]
MAEVVSPITRQIARENRGNQTSCIDIRLEEVDDCLIYDRTESLFLSRTCIETGNRCKEYVDDLSRIPREVLEDADIRLIVIGQSAHHHIEPFCSLTGYPHEIYVDPERCIYQKLGMKREEKFTDSARPSPHVKSGVFMGQMKSIWRAMTSPAFDFQGDLHQQGSQVHFSHFDMNRLDHMPIPWLLQLAGVQQTLDLSDRPKIIHTSPPPESLEQATVSRLTHTTHAHADSEKISNA